MVEYAKRDAIGLGSYYTLHVASMTSERLHEKSDIAAELAHRDMKIDRLRAELKEITQACTDPRVNLTATLAECVRDAYSDIERLRAELTAARALLTEAREALEYWTPDESMATTDESEVLNGYYALRDRIDAALAKGE